MQHAISALGHFEAWPEELLDGSDPRRADLECIGEGVVWADSKDGFHYLEQTLVVTGVDTEIVGTDPQPIQVGTTADGAFSCSLVAPTSAGIGLIGLYFHFGRLGLIFHPLAADSSIKYRGVSYDEFVAAVAEDHGVTIQGPKLG